MQLRQRAFCFKRNIDGIGMEDGNARLYVDVAAQQKLDEEAQALLLNLRETKLPFNFPAANLYEYTVKWHPDGITYATHREHVLHFCSDVYWAMLESGAHRCVD